MAKWLVETTRGTGAGRVLGFALALAAGVAAPMVAAAEMPVVKLQTVKVSDADEEGNTTWKFEALNPDVRLRPCGA